MRIYFLMGGVFSKKKTKKIEIKYHASGKKDPKVLKSSNEPNILIVGAGVSGIACAIDLLKYGFKSVRIVEASNRIGGRINTVQFGDGVIDLGAEWVHGQLNNAVYETVFDKDLLETNTNYAKAEWIRSNGDVIHKETASLIMNALENICSNINDSDVVEYDGAFGEFIKQKLLNAMTMEPLNKIDQILIMECLESYRKMFASAATSGLEQMSLNCFDKLQQCSGEKMLHWKQRGFKQFLRELLQADDTNECGILKGLIDFNTRVEQIEWDNIDGTVNVHCNDNRIIVADHVVITVPIGVLKKNTHFFKPLLPADKRRAISFTSFGNVCKIYLEYAEKFWQSDWFGFTAIWSDNDLSVLRKSKMIWITYITGCYCVDYQPRLLQCWAIGANIDVIETLTFEELEAGIVFMLKKFLPQNNVTSPMNILTSKWSTDPNFLGSFSYSSLLTDRYFTGPQELMQPINVMAYSPCDNASIMTLRPMTVRPILLFAGEGTSENHFSTVHGALETGKREAARLSGYHWRGT